VGGRKGYYLALGKALASLYGPGSLRLAGGDKDLFTFDASVVDNAIEALHRAGRFRPEILGTQAGRALIGENHRVLSEAIDKGVKKAESHGLRHEIPAELTAALKDNAFIFSGFKAYHTFAEAGTSLVNEHGGIVPLDTFKQTAGDVFKRHNLNLTSEYNFAISSAQMASKWNDIEADGDRYDLQYRTAGDDKVRESHAAMNGTTLPPSDPFWQEFYPPNDWGCRCTAEQVLKDKYPRTDSRMAIDRGDSATSNDKQKIFRFNAGAEKKTFPDKHPYFPKGCGDCDKSLLLAYGNGRPECQACKIIQSMRTTMERIPTTNGTVMCSSGQGANEREENIAIATHFAEAHGHEIHLLPRAHNMKTADAYNKTLGVEMEFKTNRTPTKGAIDNELKAASKQANHVVLCVDSAISDFNLRNGIKGRVTQAKNIETVTVLRHGKDTTYTRTQILEPGFEL